MFSRRAWNLASVFLALLLLLSGRIVWWQLVRGPALQSARIDPVSGWLESANAPEAFEVLLGADPEAIEQVPAPLLQRARAVLENIERGSIYDRDGELLAYTDADSGRRIYADPSLGPVTGYVSGIGTGVTGLEAAYNQSLLGLDRLDAQARLSLRQPVRGSDLELTIDSGVQAAAVEAMAGRPGALVALDAHTGAVLALVSNPHFDPNQVLDENYLASLLACGDDPTCRAPFVNRATQARYTPGSTWKTVTLIAGLDTGQISPETIFDFGEPRIDENGRPVYIYAVGGGEIPDPNHEERQLDLTVSYALSANAAFARIAAEMPPETFVEYARRLGFGAPGEVDFEVGLPYVPSQLANDPQEVLTNDLLRAASGIGQGELLASPLNMAMVAAAVINDGQMPIPTFVQRVRAPSGVALPRIDLGGEVTVMRPETAESAQQIMATTVEQGYIAPAQIPGIRVGGKTGTAQLGGELGPHAWFIGWAELDNRAVALAIVLENAGGGYRLAAPLFAQVAPIALEALGD
jgi:peptidoglycan glycosyltransferase